MSPTNCPQLAGVLAAAILGQLYRELHDLLFLIPLILLLQMILFTVPRFSINPRTFCGKGEGKNPRVCVLGSPAQARVRVASQGTIDNLLGLNIRILSTAR